MHGGANPGVMMRSYIRLFFFGCLIVTLCPAAWAQRFVSGEEAAKLLVVRNIETGKDGSVSGVLFNKSLRTQRDVWLLVRHTWLWRNERSPGNDNPSRTAYFQIKEEIPPGELKNFRYSPDPPLVSRKDGHFETLIEVFSFNDEE